MKGTYLSRDFRETAAQCFPSQAKELNAFFDARLNVLLAENADASKEKQYHLKRQILPGIAAYETLHRVMPKEEALQTVHGYVEELARTSHKQLAALLHIPGLYRLVPGVFVKSTRSVFGPAAGFDSKELQVGNGIWRVDMMKCPYHDTCVAYGCPELCCCFCDSDDISYAGLHPKLVWHRTKTLGRVADRWDFCMKTVRKEKELTNIKTAVVYWSGTGNTEAMARAVAEGMTAAGAEAVLLTPAEIASGDLNAYAAIAFGCPAMGSEVLEEMEFQPMFDACKRSLGGKRVALFGSYGWGDGEWMRTWESDCDSAGVNLVCESVICTETPDETALEACRALGKALAE